MSNTHTPTSTSINTETKSVTSSTTTSSTKTSFLPCASGCFVNETTDEFKKFIEIFGVFYNISSNIYPNFNDVCKPNKIELSDQCDCSPKTVDIPSSTSAK